MNSEKSMTLYDHVGELRKRIMWALIAFFVFLIVGFFLAKHVIVYLQSDPIAKDIQMNAFHLTDPLNVYMTFAFFIGCVLAAPVVLYQLWAFISPGLYENERKVTLMYIPIAFLLFLTGLAFSYFILFPFVVSFMGNVAAALSVEGEYGIQEYFSFLFNITLPFGLLFQFPVLIMFLTRLGIVTPDYLKRIRKVAYFGILVIAGFITPPELMSHLMVTFPLILLYEISIIISRTSYKKRMKAEVEALVKEKEAEVESAYNE